MDTQIITVGCKVFRKGRSLQWGIVRSVFESHHSSDAKSGPMATVDWHAPFRRGGRGFHTSTLKVAALMLATEEETLRRKAWLEAKKQQDAKPQYNAS